MSRAVIGSDSQPNERGVAIIVDIILFANTTQVFFTIEGTESQRVFTLLGAVFKSTDLPLP